PTMNTKNKQTICIILAIALTVTLIGSFFSLSKTMSVYNGVIAQELRGISMASDKIAYREVDILDTTAYEESMHNYFISVGYAVLSINEISENSYLYRKYQTPNLYGFIEKAVAGSVEADDKSIKDRKKCIDTIKKISKELENKIFLSRDYNYVGDPQGVSKTIEKIETICKEWK
ncbi:MAG: hypothetical protein RR063_00005, partial [Anaerovoracaceae bacterium]